MKKKYSIFSYSNFFYSNNIRYYPQIFNILGKLNIIIYISLISSYFSQDNNITIIFQNSGQGVDIINRHEFEGTLKRECPKDYENGTCCKNYTGANNQTTIYWEENNTFDDLSYMFHGKTALIEINLSEFNASNIKYMSYMFCNCISLQKVILPSITHENLEIIESMFEGCTSLISVEFTGNNFNTKNTNTFKKMFLNCISLISINFPDNFQTNGAKEIQDMFSGCSSLISINFQIFNTFNVNNMACLFKDIKVTSFNLEKFDTHQVTAMEFMFRNCSNLSMINLSNFNYSILSNMEEMFSYNNEFELVDFGKNPIGENVNTKNIFLESNKRMIIYVNKSNPEAFFGEYNNNFTIVECGNLSKENVFKSYPENKIVCVESCNKLTNYKYNYKNECFKDCPPHIIKNETNFICEDNSTIPIFPTSISTFVFSSSISTIIPTETKIITILLETSNYILRNVTKKTTKFCNTKDFFFDDCSNVYQTSEDKDLFAQNIIKDIMNGNLNDILTPVVNEGKILIKEDQNEKYQISTISSQKYLENMTSINFGECEEILKANYSINQSEELIIFKIEHTYEGINIPIIEYVLFSNNGSITLDLGKCENLLLEYNTPVSIDSNEIYKYDLSSEYYSDLCKKYSSGNTDLTLYDRKYEFNSKNMSLCEYNCTYQGYDSNTSKVECKCSPKNYFLYINNTKDKNNTPLLMQAKAHQKNINFDVTQCINLATSKSGLITNPAFYILLVIITFLIIVGIIFCCKGYEDLNEKMEEIIDKMFSSKKNKGNYRNKKKKNGPPKKEMNNRNKKGNNFLGFNKKMNNRNNITNNKSELITTLPLDNLKEDSSSNDLYNNDYELNRLTFIEAMKFDKRKFNEYYCSLICYKQILIFSFLNIGDYTPSIIKKFIFFLSFALHYATNALFFNDHIMHQIYEDNGSYNFIYQIPFICYSFIISGVFLRIIMETLVLVEKNFLEIKRKKSRLTALEQKKRSLKCIMIKYIIFFVLCSVLLIVFWIYLTCFSAVYKKTQIHLIKNTLISFGFSSIYPFLINLIPGIFRRDALKPNTKKAFLNDNGERTSSIKVLLKNREYVYKISKIFQLL